MSPEEHNKINQTVRNLEVMIDRKIAEIVKAENEGNKLEAEGLEVVIDTLMDKQDAEILKIVDWSLERNTDRNTRTYINKKDSTMFIYSQKVKDYILKKDYIVI